jgi:hypothetical protein
VKSGHCTFQIRPLGPEPASTRHEAAPACQTEHMQPEWIAEMGLAFEAAPAAPESLVDLPRPGLPQTQLFALLSYREACRLGPGNVRFWG